MSHGIRANAETAVRSGLRFILFARQPEEDAVALDEYLKSLEPVPSPALVDGKLAPAARRGREIFLSAKTGCAACHPAPLFTDLKFHDVGTRAKTDTAPDFDTPTLVEMWRSAPYLHDGSAANLRDVLTTFNRGDKHGRTSQLSEREIQDLAEYLRSI
jgi:cytochrome c peroxidase